MKINSFHLLIVIFVYHKKIIACKHIPIKKNLTIVESCLCIDRYFYNLKSVAIVLLRIFLIENEKYSYIENNIGFRGFFLTKGYTCLYSTYLPF